MTCSMSDGCGGGSNANAWDFFHTNGVPGDEYVAVPIRVGSTPRHTHTRACVRACVRACPHKHKHTFFFPPLNTVLMSSLLSPVSSHHPCLTDADPTRLQHVLAAATGRIRVGGLRSQGRQQPTQHRSAQHKACKALSSPAFYQLEEILVACGVAFPERRGS